MEFGMYRKNDKHEVKGNDGQAQTLLLLVITILTLQESGMFVPLSAQLSFCHSCTQSYSCCQWATFLFPLLAYTALQQGCHKVHSTSGLIDAVSSALSAVFICC